MSVGVGANVSMGGWGNGMAEWEEVAGCSVD
jgi:hypothetical protein